MIKNKWLTLGWHIAIVGGIALYLVFSLTYLFLGQPNADEGWYLYASKLVFEGKNAISRFCIHSNASSSLHLWCPVSEWCAHIYTAPLILLP